MATSSTTRNHITLEPALVSDMPRLMSIMFAAFHEENYHETVDNVRVPLHLNAPNHWPVPPSWPTPDKYEDDIQAAAGNRYLSQWQSNLVEEEVIKAVDASVAGTERIVGWSRWIVHANPRPASVWNEELPPHPAHAESLSQPQREAIVTFTYPSERKRRALHEGRPYVDVGMLCIDPAEQGKGVGRLMAEYGQARATKLQSELRLRGENGEPEMGELAEGVVVHLESTQAGIPLYQKVGFKQVDQVVLKKEWWGGEKDAVYPVMWWHPGQRREKIDGLT